MNLLYMLVVGSGALAVADDTPPRAVDTAILGAGPADAWSATIQGGYAWSSVRAKVGLTDRVALAASVDTALFQRFEPEIGVSIAAVRTERFRLGVEALIGATVQTPLLARYGPAVHLRVVTGWTGPVVPYLALGSRHLLLIERTVITSSEGTRVDSEAQHAWTPGGTVGLGVPIGDRFGLDMGVDWYVVDEAFSIPGFHAGVHVGGGR